MKKIRNNTFETNSSSTHTLTIGKLVDNYEPISDNIKIRWIDTDEESILATLKDKVSYLVSHIASWYMYDVEDYEDLVESVRRNNDFRKLENYLQKTFHKGIIFPKYDGDIEEIVNINHQLVSWDKNLDEVLRELVEERNYLKEVLDNGNIIEFGRD